MDRVNCWVCACACANECIMRLFDWWGCYCQSILHRSSPPFLSLSPSLFHLLPPLMVSYFSSRLFSSPSSWLSFPPLSLLLTFCPFSSHSQYFLFFAFLFSLVPASTKLRIQDGQRVQDGGLWPRKPNGGWNRGQFDTQKHKYMHMLFTKAALSNFHTKMLQM